MTKNTKISYLLLGLIFLLALFLRLYRLNIDSPALYADEVGHFFYYKLLKLPDLGFIKRLTYLVFSATWLVGLNPLGVRLFSAIYGSLIVLVGFFFAKAVSKSSGSNLYLRLGLVFALLVAISPWNFAISRLGHTHIPIVVLLSLLHLTLYLQANSWRKKLVSFIPFLLGGYFYPTLIIMAPFVLLLPAKELLWDNAVNKKYLFAFLGVFIFATSYILINKYQIFSNKSRGLDLAIWRDANVTADSNLYRGLARTSSPSIFSFGVDPEKLANKIVFNYPVSVISEFTNNYLSFFSPNFLFLKGDLVLRHSTGMVGNLYPFLLPFIILGAFIFFKDQTTRNKIIFITWILASPLPSAITKDGATYLLRAVTLMPFLTYFSALGLVESFNLIRRNWRLPYGFLITIIALYSSYYYFYGYFHVYPALSATSFEFGFKELADFQTKNPGTMFIVWDDKYPYTHFCFWQNLPLNICQPENTNTRVFVNKSRVDLSLPTVFFSLPNSLTDLELITNQYQPKFFVLPDKYQKKFPPLPKYFKIVETIKNPDLTPAFEIYQLN